MNEIGSEFWTDNREKTGGASRVCDDWQGDKRYFLSGRTALDAIIRDILCEHDIKTAYLPSYCCHTMIEPFIRHGIKIDFYPVVFENGRLNIHFDTDFKHDVTLTLDYFGFGGYSPAYMPETISIHDLTHSLLSDNISDYKSDYSFASFRKWGVAAGAAVACKTVGKLFSDAAEVNDEYIKLRKRADRMKAAYINGDTGDKSFLDLFNEAETMLENDYVGYTADGESLDLFAELKQFVASRRENAAVLFAGLSASKLVKPMFTQMSRGDVPLFVPVLVGKGQRDALKKYLIENRIYCPTHWPLSDLHNFSPDAKHLYEQELSLVCDQRYSVGDMKRIITVIGEFETRV